MFLSDDHDACISPSHPSETIIWGNVLAFLVKSYKSIKKSFYFSVLLRSKFIHIIDIQNCSISFCFFIFLSLLSKQTFGLLEEYRTE